jgi:hypothetical protein
LDNLEPMIQLEEILQSLHSQEELIGNKSVVEMDIWQQSHTKTLRYNK